MPHPNKVCPKCGAVTSRLRRHVETEHKRRDRGKGNGRPYDRQTMARRVSRTRSRLGGYR